MGKPSKVQIAKTKIMAIGMMIMNQMQRVISQMSNLIPVGAVL
jgi:hypothetical protein